jgi:hypothetical protein
MGTLGSGQQGDPLPARIPRRALKLIFVLHIHTIVCALWIDECINIEKNTIMMELTAGNQWHGYGIYSRLLAETSLRWVSQGH